MDLALEFGMPVSALTKVLKESELRHWSAYAARYKLPTRRLQLQLAQIALMVARANGGARDLTLDDFLFDPPEPLTPEENLRMAKETFGFKPRTKKDS